MPRTLLSPLVSTLALLLCAVTPAQKATKDPGLEKLRITAREAVKSGQFAVAEANFAKITKASPEDAEAWHMLGYALHAQGKLDEALPIHEKAFEFPAVAATAAYNAACVHALKGNPDAAFGWLKKAVTAGFDQADHIKADPDLKGLHEDPRFAKVLAVIEKRAEAGGVQVYAVTNERKCARLALFDRKGSPAQIAIQYTPVAWQAKYDELAKSEKMLGRWWRFGGDFWTTLDCSVDLAIGEEKLPAGYYYLTLRQTAPDKFELGVHDAAAVREQHLDAFQADRLQGGQAIPLAHERIDESADELMIGVKAKGNSPNHGLFVVRFGPHVLTAPLGLALAKVKKVAKGL